MKKSMLKVNQNRALRLRFFNMKTTYISDLYQSEKFVEDTFHRLNTGSVLRRALKEKIFREQYHVPPPQLNENYLLNYARDNKTSYSPLPFLIAAEFITCLNLYRITKKPEFFALLEDNIELIIAERDSEHGFFDPCRQKIGSGWGCNFVMPGQWTHDVGTSSSVAFPITLFIVECMTSGLSNKEKISKYIQICQNVADDFMDDISLCENGAYLRQPGMSDIEPSNLTAHYICLLIMTYKLTGLKKYFLAAEKLALYIKQSFRYEEGETVCWPYRGNMPLNKSTHGERYWKSPWVVVMMMLCQKTGCVFTQQDLLQVVHTIKTNLIRNETQVYDSLSRQSGVLIDQSRIDYHTEKGQSFSMKRLINFIPLAVVDDEIAPTLEKALMANKFYKNFCENFLALENYWVLEGLSSFLNYKQSVFNFDYLLNLTYLPYMESYNA